MLGLGIDYLIHHLDLFYLFCFSFMNSKLINVIRNYNMNLFDEKIKKEISFSVYYGCSDDQNSNDAIVTFKPTC